VVPHFPFAFSPRLKLLKPFSVAAHEKPAVLKTDGDTPIVADFRYFPDFISQSEFAFPGERFGKEFDPITYLETVPFHLAFAFRPSSTRRRKRNGPSVRGTLRPPRESAYVSQHDSITRQSANRSRFEPVCAKLESASEQIANVHSNLKTDLRYSIRSRNSGCQTCAPGGMVFGDPPYTETSRAILIHTYKLLGVGNGEVLSASRNSCSASG
jgi:hypothetical protein